MTTAAADAAASTTAPPRARDETRNPYPGLRPFESDEKDFFVGRDLVLPQVETRVRTSPLTVLFARSGVGKSSFLNCRLQPALLTESDCRPVKVWAGKPEDRIAEAVGSLKFGTEPAAEKPVLILDQFEDVFKSGDDRRGLWNALGAIVNVEEPPVHVLVSMREEWLGAWVEAAQYLPDAYRTLYRLEPLSRDELTSVVTLPPQLVGSSITVEPEFVKELLDDLTKKQAFGFGNAYVEPGMVQLACRRMWAEAATSPRRALDRTLYARLGRIDGIIEDFVWNALLDDTGHERFTPEEQIYWVAITQQLSLAYGVKAIVTADAICRKLRIEDFGVAGEAVLTKTLERGEQTYLRKVGVRQEPPVHLAARVSAVLDKGVAIGFLKPQKAVKGGHTLYELHHDALGPFLTTFAATFEQALNKRTKRVARLLSLFSALLIIAVFALIYTIVIVSFSGVPVGLKHDWLVILSLALGGAFAIAVYAGFVRIGMWMSKKVSATLGYPMIRRLVRNVRPEKYRHARPRV